MVQEQLVKDSVDNGATPKMGLALQLRIVMRFFTIWLSSLAVLVVIALLSNIEWARKHVETALNQSFHRQVRLGRLSWSFGLQGLALDSDRFEMKDRDGSPFVTSGPAEIGIAFLPLLQKRLVIKHLQFNRPEVWASKIDEKNWNFSDLLTEGPEIRMVRIEDGRLHLHNLQTRKPIQTSSNSDSNAQNTANGDAQDGKSTPSAKEIEDIEGSWKTYDIQDIKLSVTMPKKNRNWPVFLSCKVPSRTPDNKPYETAIRLSATGKGDFQDWQKNKYIVDLQLQKFDPTHFRPLYSRIPNFSGICDLHFKGEGVFTDGFLAAASAKVSNLKLDAAENKKLELAQATANANLMIAPESISWKGLKLSLADWQLDSEGKLLNWQKDNTSYEARVGGKLNDLKGFFDNVLSCFLPDQTSAAHKKYNETKLEKIGKTQKNGNLPGTATIQLQLSGDKNAHNVSTNIKAEGIPLAQLVDDEVGTNFMEVLKLNPNAPIRGELSISPGKKLEVKDLEIPLEDSKLKLTGFMNQETKQTEFEFSADNMSFDTIKKRLGDDNELVKAICAPSGKAKPYNVSGKLDIKGKYKSDGKEPDVYIDSELKGLRLTRQDSNAAACSNIKGKIVYKNGIIDIKQLSGITNGGGSGPNGDFLINGKTNLKDYAHADMELRAHEVSIAQLKDWLNRFNVNIQLPGLDKISGDLHELRAHVSTRDNQMNTSFTINPADLLLTVATKPGDAPQQFRLSSGSITYDNNEFSASDVNLSSKGGKVVVSANLQGRIDNLKLLSARLKTEGFELADLQSILKGNFNPSKPTPSTVPDFMIPSAGSSLHGKVYGEINLLTQGNNSTISGVVGFHNAGGKFGKSQLLVEKLTGVAVISKDQLVLQDTAGQLGKSSFSLDGVITYFASPNYSWLGQLRGQFYPDEVDLIMDNLGHGIGLDSTASEALNLRVTGSGDKAGANCSFRGRAGATQGLGLKTAFGTFHQPKGRPLTFHGSLNLNELDSQLAINNFQLSSSTENLQANGTFKWANDKEEKPAAISFALVTPTPVKSATLLEITSQTNDGSPVKVGGTSQLNLKVEGPVTDLVLSGSVVLDKNSIPAIHTENLSGRLDLPGWHLNKGETATSIAKLQLSTMTMGGMALHDAATTLFVDNNDRISFKDFQAALSGGKLTISGFYNPQNQAYHADVNVSKLVVDEFVKDLIDHSGGVSGLADVSMSIDNSGGNGDSPRFLSGTGQFNVYQGSVASFGKLQEKLNESNLLQQGLFGFNVNNLLQAMLPVKSGQFNEVSGKFNINKGNIFFDQLRFEGNNLRMRAAGKFDFVDQNMAIDVAGDIPRVSSSIIPGPIGEMSRKVTLQRMFSIVTFKKLKDLPALPLLGDIANDEPRAFVFNVATPTEPPKLMTQAVEKSFKWLPNKPFASAHPVPGI